MNQIPISYAVLFSYLYLSSKYWSRNQMYLLDIGWIHLNFESMPEILTVVVPEICNNLEMVEKNARTLLKFQSLF